jgi:ribosomal protein L34
MLLKKLFVQIQEQAVIQEEQETKSKKKEREKSERIRTATESSRAILRLRRWHSVI